MSGGLRALVRVVSLSAALVAATAACQLDIKLETAVERDGSGRFSLRFEVDKELVDLARNAGEDPFTALGEIPQELGQQGWQVRRSTEGGGLVIAVERAFSGPEDLNKALVDLERGLSAQEGPTARFFKLSVARSSSFLRTRTSIEGTIDLSTAGLLGESSLSAESQRTLQTLVDQAAGQFFRFTLRADLPGSVSETTGDPQEVKSGSVTWAPQLGKQLAFRASASAYNGGTLFALAVPGILVLGLAGWLVARRRPRVAG